MATTDREVMRQVVGEWLCGGGISIKVRLIASMLYSLEEAYGDQFTIDGACDALEDLTAH